MKKRPTVDMNASAENFMTVVQTWTDPMFLMPVRLMAAGSQSPTSTSPIENHLLWPVFTNSSTYSTHPTAIAALPAQAVIQYDQAFANPNGLPNATRAYAYGPPSAGIRRDKPANRSASAKAPTVVRAMATR